MTPAKLTKASLCFTTTEPSLRARPPKPQRRFARPATPRKPIASRTSCASTTRITPADSPGSASSKPSLLGDNGDAPGAAAGFDAAQFFARFEIDDRDVV